MLSCAAAPLFGLVLATSQGSPATPAPEATPAATEPQAPEPGFLRRLGGDYRRTFASGQGLLTLGIGGGGALSAWAVDRRISRSSFNSELHHGTALDAFFEAGDIAGGAGVQLGGAALILAVGKLAGDPRVIGLGDQLVRAQIVSGTFTFALKWTIRRERPDASNRLSFPSGHTSAAFATAAVLQGRYGLKAGVPAYGVAAWVAAARLSENKHFLSDVVFGAAIGIASGRSVAVGRGKKRLVLAPQVVPGGGVGIQFTLIAKP